MCVTIHADSVFYVLHVDGVGEYAMRHQDGSRCLFVFTNKKTISDFVELMEKPEQKNFSAIPFDVHQIIGFLTEILPQTQLIAIDPPASCEFSPVATKDFIAVLCSCD